MIMADQLIFVRCHQSVVNPDLVKPMYAMSTDGWNMILHWNINSTAMGWYQVRYDSIQFN